MMLLSQSGKGCLSVILIILVLGLGVVWLFPFLLGIPLEGRGTEDLHIVLAQDGTGEHTRGQTGYGVILECEGVINAPTGSYRLIIMTDDEVAYEGPLNAGQKIHYKLKSRWGNTMTVITHKLKGLSGQKDIKVTYVFTYTYSYKSLLNRLIPGGE